MTNYVQTQFPSGIGAQFEPAFDDAADFWSDVITAGQPGARVGNSAISLAGCGVAVTLQPGTVLRGVTIFAQVKAIDGVGNVLGNAGPCLTAGNFPVVGVMTFDSADSQSLVNSGQFDEVVKHEMGHVIGIGSLWGTFNLVRNPCTATPCNTVPTYRGANGISGFNALGGTGSLRVADENGPGTFNAHWKESTFGNELMTGFLNSNSANPLSIMSIRSLKDLGYSVDESKAESYSIPRRRSEGEDDPEVTLSLEGDVTGFEIRDIEELGGSIESGNGLELAGMLALVAAGVALVVALVVVAAKRQRKNVEKVSNDKEETQV